MVTVNMVKYGQLFIKLINGGDLPVLAFLTG